MFFKYLGPYDEGLERRMKCLADKRGLYCMASWGEGEWRLMSFGKK